MKQTPRHSRRNASPHGFTLIEMMIAVGLTMVMMTLFTVIFQLAAGSVSTQRGIAKNDQRARTFSTLLRSDLQNRTFESVVPFLPGEVDPGDPLNPRAFDRRRGYFYVSENNPDLANDDVLAFTIEVGNDSPLYAQARTLGIPEQADVWSPDTEYETGDWVQRDATFPPPLVYRAMNDGTSSSADPANWATTAGNTSDDNGITWRAFTPERNRNQPDWDDGQGGNSSGQSTVAEVVYFVRGNTLYRRLLLIRPDLASLGFSTAQPEDATVNPGDEAQFLDPAYAVQYRGNFWNDFDYSAYQSQSINGIEKAQFLSAEALVNSDGTTPPAAGTPELGRPRFRFGHNVPTGNPKEYLSNASADNFIGRYVYEETSNDDFQYPQYIDTATGISVHGNIMQGGNGMGFTLNDRNIVTQLEDGPRRGEDILLTNVLRFDVKLWDDLVNGGAGGFVDVGHDGATGNLRQANNIHAANGFVYGPRNAAAQNRVFDTWHAVYDHPSFNVAGRTQTVGTETADPPPFELLPSPPPMTYNPNVDREPVRAVQINIQYYDESTGQIREVSIVESLVSIPD